SAWLIAPAQKVLGLDWVIPDLARAVRVSKAPPVFLEGRVRNLLPLDWWKDPALIQKRIGTLRELVGALSGHPALRGWVVMDRALDWFRPKPRAADLVLKSVLGEIRERDDAGRIILGLGWREILSPETVRILASQVDGIRVGGFESPPPLPGIPANPAGELLAAAFVGALARWIFSSPPEVEVGWGAPEEEGDLEDYLEAAVRLREAGLGGVCWFNCIDPYPGTRGEPPWSLRPGMDRAGLLDPGSEPRLWVRPCLREILSSGTRDGADDFIDLDREEYLEDPGTHFERLWEHYRER
ncbi:MAG: hypothetical protein JW821_00555, partial [Deltaproteobacteria bacterium]|nr:hypothetical protein [Deltaproteobacteria bacterium]